MAGVARVEDPEAFETEASVRAPIFHKEGDHGELQGADTLEMVVWLRDKKGLHLELQGSGHTAEVSEVFQIIKTEKELPNYADKIFSLWMVSPLLELRLKDGHKPFEIAQLWDRFCWEYADAKNEEIARDEPVVMFQRNVFLSIQDEKRYWSSAPEELMALLYHEAKYNIVSGRYLVSDDHYDSLAGIQALLEKGPFSRALESYKDDIKNYYPRHIYKPKRRGRKPANPERLRDAHQVAFNNTNDMTRRQLYCQYLDVCVKYPFYGCAFFEAVLQKPCGNFANRVNRSLARGFPEREVTVTINTEGLCIIDEEEKEVLLVVPYEQLSWDFKKNDADDKKLPTLYVQFLVKKDKTTRVVQIYSKQATFMDALVDTCVEKKRREGTFDTSEDKNEVFCNELCNKLDSMCLKKYSLTGESLAN